MRFSLIVATLGRVDELRALLGSLAAQSFRDAEVIVVDQNDDDRLGWLDSMRGFPMPVRRVRLAIKRASVARNVGLQLATGDLVGFPDDDCLYPPRLLADVARAFAEDPRLGVRAGPAESPHGGTGSGRWQPGSGEIGLRNVWTCVICFNIFLRRDLALAIGGFDERIGPGSPFGSCEENDLVLRAIHSGWRGWYEFDQRVVHPDKTLSPVAVERAFAYGAGMGYALRKHRVPPSVWLTFLVRPLGGCVISLVRLSPRKARYYWRSLRGRAWGFRVFPADHITPLTAINANPTAT
jgi:glycosyltransferase involved in cell wall biosynthesis